MQMSNVLVLALTIFGVAMGVCRVMSIIAQPRSATPQNGFFVLEITCKIATKRETVTLPRTLQNRLAPATGFALPIATKARHGAIALALDRRMASLGTKYIPNAKHLGFMAFPRACAFAEVLWCPAELKNCTEFLKRLDSHLKGLTVLDINFRKIDSQEAMRDDNEGLQNEVQECGLASFAYFAICRSKCPSA